MEEPIPVVLDKDEFLQYCKSVKHITDENSLNVLNIVDYDKRPKGEWFNKKHRVIAIGDFLFLNNEKLEVINFNKYITKIGVGAFRGTSLTTVNFPESLEEIGNNAFTSCPLKSVTFSNGLRKIGDYAFSDCTDLKTVDFPESLEEIGDYAFSDCPLKNITFSNGLKKIGDYAFSGSSCSEVVIPDSVEEIGENAFEGVEFLKYNGNAEDDGSHWGAKDTSKAKAIREADAEAKRKAEEEKRKKAEEEAKKKLEEARLKAEIEARKRAEEEEARKREEDARKRLEEEEKRRAEEEKRKIAEAEAKRKAEEEARKKAEEEARKKAEEARKKIEEEALLKKYEDIFASSSETEEETEAFVVSNVNTCLKKIFPNISDTAEIEASKWKLDTDETINIESKEEIIVIESGSLSFIQSPEIELREGDIATRTAFVILGGSETPSFRTRMPSSIYILNITEISDLISPLQLQKQQERLILTKAFESNHSKLLTSLEFDKLIKEMYSRFKVSI